MSYEITDFWRRVRFWAYESYYLFCAYLIQSPIKLLYTALVWDSLYGFLIYLHAYRRIKNDNEIIIFDPLAGMHAHVYLHYCM